MLGVRCPECNLLLKRIKKDELPDVSIDWCYGCNKDIEISYEDIYDIDE